MADAMQRAQQQIEEAHAVLKKAQAALDRSAAVRSQPGVENIERSFRQTMRLATDKERQAIEQRVQEQIDRIAHERTQGAEALRVTEPEAASPTRRRRPRQTV